MREWFKRLKDAQEGITLIELIVVVAIIGVLAWLITPRVLETLNTAKTTSAEGAANEIMAALERFAAQNNTYPLTAALDDVTELNTALDINASGRSKLMDETTWAYFGEATQFCASFTAADREGTRFKIQQTGLTFGDPTTITACAGTGG